MPRSAPTKSATSGDSGRLSSSAGGAYCRRTPPLPRTKRSSPKSSKAAAEEFATANSLTADLAKDPSSPELQTTITNLIALGEKRGLVFGKPSAAQDQNAFAVTTAFADKNGLRTLSDLAAKCSGAATVLGGPAECPQRPKCRQGLVDTYDFKAGKFSSLDAGGPLTLTALKTGTVSVGLRFSSDPALASS